MLYVCLYVFTCIYAINGLTKPITVAPVLNDLQTSKIVKELHKNGSRVAVVIIIEEGFAPVLQ